MLIQYKERNRTLLRAITIIVASAFLCNDLAFALATLPASQNPTARVEILAALERMNIRIAEDEGPAANRLLDANYAEGLLLSSGTILVPRAACSSDLKLLLAVRHEQAEALFQIMAGFDKDKYQGLKELVLKHFPPGQDNELPINLYVNHALAKTLEWLMLAEERLITIDDIPKADGERDYVLAVKEKIIDPNRHNYFGAEFWVPKLRSDRIKEALERGLRFYQVSNKRRARQSPEENQSNLPRLTAPKGAIPFDEYIRFQDVYRSETDDAVRKRFDISKTIFDAQAAKELMASYRKLRPKRIDTIITRQTTETYFQSIVELIANAIDATENASAAKKKHRPIGRFGMGGLQMLIFVLEASNPPISKGGAEAVIETKAPGSKAYRIRFFKDDNLKLSFVIEPSGRKEAGTNISLRWHGEKDEAFLGNVHKFLDKFSLSTRMPIYINEKLLNRLDGYLYLDGEALEYSNPDSSVKGVVSRSGVVIMDSGEGMGLEKILSTYLIPREGRGIPKGVPTEEEVAQEVAFFYKAPQKDKHSSGKMKVSLQVSGVRIQTFELEGVGLPEELVLELPSLSNLNVSRNEVILDEVTHIAIKVFAKKLIDPAKKTPHKDALINGFIEAVKWLDKHNGRKKGAGSILNEARSIMVPWASSQSALIVPNEEVFHEMKLPDNTRFLDSSLIAGLHPSALPLAQRLENGIEFEPGTCLEAYTMPFKKGSGKSYAILGDYLIVNKALYERHKNLPTFLNLRLNFYIGYGDPSPPKGRFLRPDEINKARRKKGPKKAVFDIKDFEKEFKFLRLLNPELRTFVEGYLNKNFSKAEEAGSYLASVSKWLDALPAALVNKGEVAIVLAVKPSDVEKLGLPDKEFLNKYLHIYADPKDDQAFFRYISNIVKGRTFSPSPENRELYNIFLSFVPETHSIWLDDKFLADFKAGMKEYAKASSFDIGDFDRWRLYFSGANEAFPHLKDKESFQRFMIRWLRLFLYDPEKPARFIEMLKKPYARKIPIPDKEEKAGGDFDYSKIRSERLISAKTGPSFLNRVIGLRKGELKGHIAVVSSLNNDISISIINRVDGSVVSNMVARSTRQTHGFDTYVRNITEVEDGKLILFMEYEKPIVVDPVAGREIHNFFRKSEPHWDYATILRGGAYEGAIASINTFGNIDIFDPVRKKTVKKIEDHEGCRAINDVGAFSNGDIVVLNAECETSGGGKPTKTTNNMLSIFDITKKDVKKNIEIEGFGHGGFDKMAVLPGDFIAMAEYDAHEAVIIDPATGKEVNRVKVKNRIRAIESTAEGELMVATVDGNLHIFEFGRSGSAKEDKKKVGSDVKYDYTKPKAGKTLEKAVKAGNFIKMAIRKHGPFKGCIAICDTDNNAILIIDEKTGEELKRIKGRDKSERELLNSPFAISEGQDGVLIVSCSEGIVEIDPNSGSIVKSRFDNDSFDSEITTIAGGVLKGYYARSDSNSIDILEPARLKKIKTIHKGCWATRSMGSLSNGDLVIENGWVAEAGGTGFHESNHAAICIVDPIKNIVKRTIKAIDIEPSGKDGFRDVVVLPNNYLAVTFEDIIDGIYIINPKTGKIIKKIGLVKNVLSIALESPSTLIVCAKDKKIHYIEFEPIETAKPSEGGQKPAETKPDYTKPKGLMPFLASYAGDPYLATTLMPDNNLAILSKEGVVTIIDPKTKEIIRTVNLAMKPVALSGFVATSDGEFIVTDKGKQEMMGFSAKLHYDAVTGKMGTRAISSNEYTDSMTIITKGKLANVTARIVRPDHIIAVDRMTTMEPGEHSTMMPELEGPEGIAFIGAGKFAGNLAVTDISLNKVFIVDPANFDIKHTIRLFANQPYFGPDAIAAMPDGSLAISHTDNKHISIIDPETGRIVSTVERGKEGARDLNLTALPDGRVVITQPDSGEISILEFEQSEEAKPREETAELRLDYTKPKRPAKKILRAPGLYDMKDSTVMMKGPLAGCVVAIDGLNHKLLIVNPNTGRIEYKIDSAEMGFKKHLAAVAALPDGTIAVADSSDIKILRPRDPPEPMAKIPILSWDEIEDMALLPNGNLAIMDGRDYGGRITVIEPKTGKIIFNTKWHFKAANAIAALSDTRIAVVDGEGKSSVTIVDLSTNEEVWESGKLASLPAAIAALPDGKLAITNVDEKEDSIIILDPETGRHETLKGVGLTCAVSLSVLPDGRLVSTNVEDDHDLIKQRGGFISILDFEPLPQGAAAEAEYDYTKPILPFEKLPKIKGLDIIFNVKKFPNGMLLALCSKGLVVIDPVKNKVVRVLPDMPELHNAKIEIVDNDRFILGKEGALYLARIMADNVRPEVGLLRLDVEGLRDIYAIARLSDNTFAVVDYESNSILIVDVITQKVLRRINAPAQRRFGIMVISDIKAIDKDSLVILNRYDTEIWRLDLKTGCWNGLLVLNDIKDYLGSIEVLPDGSLAIMGNSNLYVVDPVTCKVLNKIEGLFEGWGGSVVMLDNGVLAVIGHKDGSRLIRFERKETLTAVTDEVKTVRTGFEALDPADDLDGLEPLVKNIVRFLRDQDVRLVDERPLAVRPSGWELMGEVSDIELSRMNLLFDTHSEKLCGKPQGELTLEEFKGMLASIKDADVTHYMRKIASVIAGENTAGCGWVKECGVSNPRDAVRSARRRGVYRNKKDSADIEHANFLNGDRWIYSMKDPVGMSFWELVRFWFPFDESSKVYKVGDLLADLKDKPEVMEKLQGLKGTAYNTPDDAVNDSLIEALNDRVASRLWEEKMSLGFFGLGNYTLFADFDEIFIRTSPSDPEKPGYGVVTEIEIYNDPVKGPVIRNMRLYKGDYKGTEIRRIKNKDKSDPMLESIFIQDALRAYAGAITSPERRKELGAAADEGDCLITDDGKRFQERIEAIDEVPYNGGAIRLSRSPGGEYPRVLVDEVFVKAPDKKEKRLVIDKIWNALSGEGPLQIELPASTPLNIPRTDYAGSAAIPIFHLLAKAMLRAHIEKGVELPGYPEDYMSHVKPVDDSKARAMAELMNKGRYRDIEESELAPYIEDEKMLFELMTYIEFRLSNGKSMTLHAMREEILAPLRKLLRDDRHEERVDLNDLLSGTSLSDSFSKRFVANAMRASNLFIGLTEDIDNEEKAEEALKDIPKRVTAALSELQRRMLVSIGVENPSVRYDFVNNGSGGWFNAARRTMNLNMADPQVKEFLQDAAAVMRKKGFSLSDWDRIINTVGTVVSHESQHDRQFEGEGEHSHHRDESVRKGFADRMGKAIDSLLFGFDTPRQIADKMRKGKYTPPRSQGPVSSPGAENGGSGEKSYPAQANDVSEPVPDHERAFVLSFDLLHRKKDTEPRVYEIHYDRKRLLDYQLSSKLGDDCAPEEMIKQYAASLKNRLGPYAKIVLRPSPKDGALISVQCYAPAMPEDILGEGVVDIKGDITGRLVQLTGMLNMAVAAASIRKGVDYDKMDSRERRLIGYIRSQCYEITGMDIEPGNILEFIKDLKARPVDLDIISEYYRVNTMQLRQSA